MECSESDLLHEAASVGNLQLLSALIGQSTNNIDAQTSIGICVK
jgi:hypothetical protein